MAKRNSTRRKARKPAKPIYKIAGERVSRETWEIYQAKLSERWSIVDRARDKAESLAMDDVEHAARASSHVRDTVPGLFLRSTRAATLLSSMKDFPFYETDDKIVGLGNDIIGHCAEELLAVAMQVKSMHEAIAKEISNV